MMNTDTGARETPDMHTFLARTFTDSHGYVLPYRMLAPTAHPVHATTGTLNGDPEPMPLVLVLHGAGERGNDNCAQLRNGVAELLGSATATARFPCFVLVPQCPTQHRWVEVDWTAEHHALPLEVSAPLSATVELVGSFLNYYRIDSQRLYLIGLSMGAFGVWDPLSRWPKRYAAAVSICGGADENAVTAAQAVPVWVFHGARDPIVPVARSRKVVAALEAASGTPRYIEYPYADHAAWTYAFAEADLLPWLFAHRRAKT
jgi:predicted peptidase